MTHKNRINKESLDGSDSILCPSAQTLILYTSGELDGKSRKEVAAHLAAPCSKCREQLKWYAEASETLNDSDCNAQQAGAEGMKPLEVAPNNSKPTIPVSFATPVFDSAGIGTRIGFRSGEYACVDRRLLYQTSFDQDHSSAFSSERSIRKEDCDIDIAVGHSSDSDSYSLRGEVLFKDESFGKRCKLSTAYLYKSGKFVSDAGIDDFGEFSFANLKEGHYNLHIKSDKGVVLLNLSIFPVE